MGHIRKKVVAVALSRPKMPSVLLPLRRVVGIKVQTKPKHDDLPNLKLQVFARQKDAVPGHKGQHTLVIGWQLVPYVHPFASIPHFPVNSGLRFSKNAATPSA